jgi:hypothetical protein
MYSPGIQAYNSDSVIQADKESCLFYAIIYSAQMSRMSLDEMRQYTLTESVFPSVRYDDDDDDDEPAPRVVPYPGHMVKDGQSLSYLNQKYPTRNKNRIHLNANKTESLDEHLVKFSVEKMNDPDLPQSSESGKINTSLFYRKYYLLKLADGLLKGLSDDQFKDLIKRRLNPKQPNFEQPIKQLDEDRFINEIKKSEYQRENFQPHRAEDSVKSNSTSSTFLPSHADSPSHTAKKIKLDPGSETEKGPGDKSSPGK